MHAFYLRFLRDRRGATAIEYGLIAALIAVAIIAGISATGTQLGGLFNNVANAVSGAMPSA
jgi:pilus assembly protein Flp/PilA